jgi:hypothetical protein
MHHPQRRKGSDHALLTESEIEIGTGSLLLLKIGSGTGQGTDDEEAAALAPVPVPSLLRENDGTKNEKEIRKGIGIRRTEIETRMDTDGIRTGNDPAYLLAEEKILNLGRTETLRRMKRMNMVIRNLRLSHYPWKNFWLRKRLRKKLRLNPSSSPKQNGRLKL